MKIITHYQVDITFSSDITQEELDTALSEIKIDGMREMLEDWLSKKLKRNLSEADSIVPKAKKFIMEK